MNNESARVLVPPPLPYLLLLGAGIAIHFLWRPIYIFPVTWLGHSTGWPLLHAAVALLLWAILTMRRAGEDVRVEKPTNSLVSAGPYRFSRNPIYLAFIGVYIAIALIVNSVWPLAFLPAVILVIQYAVILPEEKYLAPRLGEEYRQYRAKVRRWV